MATNMKTIKFGETGEVYSVSPRILAEYEVTTEGGQNKIDVSFDDATHLEIFLYAPVGAQNNTYTIISVNGTTAEFATASSVKSTEARLTYITIDCEKEFAYGQYYVVVPSKNQPSNRITNLDFGKFWTGDTITSFSIKAYTNDLYPVGTKLIVKGY